MPLNDKELEALKPHLNAENAAKLTAENGADLLTSQMIALSQAALELENQNQYLELFNPYHDESGRFTGEGGGAAHKTSSAAHAATAEHIGEGGGAKSNRLARMHEEAAKHGGMKQSEREYHEAAGRAFRSGGKSDHENAAAFAEKAGMKSVAVAHRGIGGKKGMSLEELEVDPDALDVLVGGTKTRINGLLACGALDADHAKKLTAVLVGEDAKPNVYALSRKATGAPKSFAAAVLDALEGNKPVKVGEKTGAQQATRELSRNVEESKELEAAQNIMVAAANRGK